MKKLFYAIFALMLMWVPVASAGTVHACSFANLEQVVKPTFRKLLNIGSMRGMLKCICCLPLAVKIVDNASPYVPSTPASWLVLLFGISTGVKFLSGVFGGRERCSPQDSSLHHKMNFPIVGVAVVAPLEIKRNEDIRIQVVGSVEKMLEKEVLKAVELDRGHQAEVHDRCFFPARDGQRLVFTLSANGLLLDESEQKIVWRSRGFKVNYFAHVPKDYGSKSVSAKLSIAMEFDDGSRLPVGSMKFMMHVVRRKTSPHHQAVAGACQYKNYFCSFAEPDYQAVMDRMQGFSICDPEWEQHAYFFVLRKPGEDWYKAEADYIENKADVFLLFWSSHAAKSDNVKDEWEMALDREKRNKNKSRKLKIVPIVIESPMPKPPKALSHIQFIDRTLSMRGGLK